MKVRQLRKRKPVPQRVRIALRLTRALRRHIRRQPICFDESGRATLTVLVDQVLASMGLPKAMAGVTRR